MERQTDIAIIGGGIAGLCLAILLGKSGIKVDIIDPSPPPSVKDLKPSGRTAALFGSSIDIIRGTDIWDDLADQAGLLKTMRIIDTHDSKEKTFTFESSDLGRQEFGFNVPNGLLRSALFERARRLKTIHLHDHEGFQSYALDKQHIVTELSSGKYLKSKLLIGADGRSSAVRAAAHIETQEKDYGQSALTFLINHSRSHDNISTEFHKKGGPLALVPLPGNQSSVVWIEPTERADHLLTLKKQDFIQHLQDQTRNILGGITLQTTPECWPLGSLKAKNLTAPRLALIAEAAHVISPIAAQGLNLSLRDVQSLSALIIAQKNRGGDLGSTTLLRSYERARRVDIGTRTKSIDILTELTGHERKFFQSLRQTGLKSLDMLPPVKHFLMQQMLAR